MPFNPDGTWKPESADVSSRVTGLIKTDSPLMTAARTKGLQTANRRGLLNSSISVQAGEQAALDVALPIASQEAAQVHQANIGSMDIGSKEKVASMNVAANDREKATAAAAAMGNSYAEAFRTIASAHDLPADSRDKYLEHLGRLRDSNMNLVEQLYGIDLDWATPTVGGTMPVTPTGGTGPANPPAGTTTSWLDASSRPDYDTLYANLSAMPGKTDGGSWRINPQTDKVEMRG